MMSEPQPEELYISYTLFDDVYPKSLTPRTDVGWSDLVKRVTNAREYPSKESCPLISMCEYGNVLSVKGYVRHGENVMRCFGVELDYDQEKIGLTEAAATLQRANIMGVFYTSASHTAYKPRWRVLLPLSEPALPEKRAEYVGRANRILGGIASTESFALSQSFYIGRVKGREYETRATLGRCIDMAADIEPLYPASHDEINRDTRTNDELREAFDRGEDRYIAMMKLSSRWAARGMEYDDICAALEDLLAKGDSRNGDGTDLRSRIHPLAESAVKKFGGKHRGPQKQEPPEKQKEPRIVLRHIADIVAERREPEWLIEDTIEENVTALMVGRRGSLKSFIAIDWFMRMALEAKGVVILSAEGSGLGRRIEAWQNVFAPAIDLRGLNLLAMEKSISLRQADVLLELHKAIGDLPFVPKAILLDTFSKFSAGIDENDNSEVAEFLESLVVAIKQHYGCTILIVAHTGHAASDRARGASSLGANTEAEYIVERPQGPELRCSVTRDRFKDSPSMPPLGYAGEIIDLGRLDKRGKPVTSIILRSGDIQPAKVRAGGANQTAAMVALREWVAAHPGKEVIPHDELAALLKRQGITSKRKPEVLNWLVNAGALLPSVGGHKVTSGAL